ncbi:MAG TPA: hypothetical protein VLG27_00495 [Candidatus Saccharimonadia bacterium]|nr:hypothetical protein [Candidatus Saccharimonadia bacterium]
MDVQTTLSELIESQHELFLAISDVQRRMATAGDFVTVKSILEDLQEYSEAGFETMNDRFDRLEDQTDRVEGRLDQVEDRLGQIDGRLERVESLLGGKYER